MRRQHSFLVSGNLSFICLSLIVFSLAGCGGGSIGTPKPIATSLALPVATATIVPSRFTDFDAGPYWHRTGNHATEL